MGFVLWSTARSLYGNILEVPCLQSVADLEFSRWVNLKKFVNFSRKLYQNEKKEQKGDLSPTVSPPKEECIPGGGALYLRGRDSYLPVLELEFRNCF